MASTVIGQFASLSVLAGIVAASLAARFDRRHALTVDDGRARVRTTLRPEPLERRKTDANLLQDPRPGPRVEIGLNRRKRRTILRSYPPTAPCPEHAGDRVHHVAQVHLTGTTKPARRWKKRVRQGPPGIGQIAFVTLRLAAILLPGGLVPGHDVPPWCECSPTEDIPCETTQPVLGQALTAIRGESWLLSKLRPTVRS